MKKDYKFFSADDGYKYKYFIVAKYNFGNDSTETDDIKEVMEILETAIKDFKKLRSLKFTIDGKVVIDKKF